jgi:DNA-binding Xre family transcriptional regulator
MARWRLREIAEPERWNARTLAIQAHLAYGTVYGLWTNRSQRVDLATLDALAALLHVNPGDLIGLGELDTTPRRAYGPPRKDEKIEQDEEGQA